MSASESRYFLRKPSGERFGPYSGAVISAMLDRGNLDGSEEVSPDGQAWQSIAVLRKAPANSVAPTARAVTPPSNKPRTLPPAKTTLAFTASKGPPPRPPGTLGPPPLRALGNGATPPPLPPLPGAAPRRPLVPPPLSLATPPPAPAFGSSQGMPSLNMPAAEPIPALGSLDFAPDAPPSTAPGVGPGPGLGLGLGLAPLSLDAPSLDVGGDSPAPTSGFGPSLDAPGFGGPGPLSLDAPSFSGSGSGAGSRPKEGPSLSLSSLPSLSLDAGAPMSLSTSEGGRLDLEGGLSLDPSLPALELDQPHRDEHTGMGPAPMTGSMTLDDLVGPSLVDAGEEVVKPKLRTMTAARLPVVRLDPDEPAPLPRKNRKVFAAVGGLALAGLLGAALAIDLPARLRGAPASATVLGPLGDRLAHDDLAAYVEAADLLDAAAERHHEPRLAADAAGLLAALAAVHGGSSGAARVEGLLAATPTDEGAPTEVKRARAWFALSRGRSAEAARLAATLDEREGPVLLGWVALLKDDAAQAVKEFTRGLNGPAPWPSRLVTELGLARAQEESGQMPAAAASYARMLQESPGYPPAVLGALRTGTADPAVRIKQAEGLKAPKAPRSSPAELAQAAILVMRAEQELGHGDRATLALKQAVATDPSSLAVAVAQGDALLAEGKLTEATAKYRAALNPTLSASRTPPVRFAAAAALLEQGHVAEAKALLEKVAGSSPRDARVPYWQGRADELGTPPDPLAAERHYGESLARDPRFVPATLQLARLLIERKRGGEALTVCRRAEQAGASAQALKVSLGRAMLASGNVDGARHAFEEALASDPEAPGARLGLAAAMDAAGRLGDAKAQLELLMKKAPETPGLRASLAEILMKTGRLDDALVVYQEDIRRGPVNPGTQIAAIRLALQLGKKDVARTLAEKLVETDPRTPGALLLLAEVRKADGDLGRALTELRRALAYENTPEAHFEYAKVLAATGREDDATEELLQAGSIPEARIERGRLLLRRGQLGGAADELEVAVKMQQGSANAWLLLGNVRDRLGQTPAAEAAWKMALKLAPENAEAHYRYGRLLVDRGQVAAGLPQLHAAEGKEPPGSPWGPDLYFQIGFAERTGGSRHAAVAAYRKYLAMAPADAPSRVEAERQLQELGH